MKATGTQANTETAAPKNATELVNSVLKKEGFKKTKDGYVDSLSGIKVTTQEDKKGNIIATAFYKDGSKLTSVKVTDDSGEDTIKDMLFDAGSLEEDLRYATEITTALSKKTGMDVKPKDFIAWYTREGNGSVARMDKAVIKLVGKDAANVAESLARLNNLIAYVLGLGPDVIGGISMRKILRDNPNPKASSGKDEPPVNSPAKPKSPNSKASAKAAEQLKNVNAAMKKLKAQKGVQNYIKLVKMQAKLKSKLG